MEAGTQYGETKVEFEVLVWRTNPDSMLEKHWDVLMSGITKEADAKQYRDFLVSKGYDSDEVIVRKVTWTCTSAEVIF